MPDSPTRRVATKKCSICGEPFLAEREDRQYCSDRCRQFAMQCEPANPALSKLLQTLKQGVS